MIKEDYKNDEDSLYLSLWKQIKTLRFGHEGKNNAIVKDMYQKALKEIDEDAGDSEEQN